MSRCKAWCFTSYAVQQPNYDERIHEYVCYGKETCPSTSRSHWQGYAIFLQRVRLAGAKKSFPGAHLEAAKGSPAENFKYCSKDGNFKEFGRLPVSSSGSNTFVDVLRAAKQGEVDTIQNSYPGIWIRYKKTLESCFEFNCGELNGSCGVWIYGPPRCGKDYGVRQLGNVYIKSLNKWWDGYKNEDNVLISDVEPDHGKWLGYFLKIWCDRYPFNAEIKGACMLIRPKRVYVTSNFSICDVFINPTILSAISARFSIYNMFEGVVQKRPEYTCDQSVLNLLLANGDGVLAEKKQLKQLKK